MDKLKKTISEYSKVAKELPDKFFDRVEILNPMQRVVNSEDIPVYTGIGDIEDPINWARITQEDLIDVQLVYEDKPKYGYLFYTSNGLFYYSLMPELFNEYSEVFAGEFLERM